MLAQLYIEALLANATLADQIWETWQCDEISNDQAAAAWTLVVANHCPQIVTQTGTRHNTDE
jgi:hypothetical protein